MSSVKLAVIVATKNRSQLLYKRSLPSVERQTKKPDFLIVCDDSDPDALSKNREIVESLDIPNCQVLYLENHRTSGASGCWNAAVDLLLSYVKSPEKTFIAFLDDDDTWEHNYLEVCKQSICRQGLDMVAAGISRFEDEVTSTFQSLAPESLDSKDFLIGNPGIQGSNLLLRLSTFLEAGGFDETLSSATDRDLCIRLSELGRVRYKALPHVLVNHYAESGRQRLSSHSSVDKLSGLTKFWQKYQGRMSIEQHDAFTQRASSLFGWILPEQGKTLTESFTSQKALILAIRSSINLAMLSKIVEVFECFKDEALVGLDVVFYPADTDNDTITSIFTEALRDLGIGCFVITEFENKPARGGYGSIDWLALYSSYVSALRPGSQVWMLESFELLDVKHYENVELFLADAGGRVRRSKEETVKLSEELQAALYRDIHQQRVLTARHRVFKTFGVKNLQTLGAGSEAIVFTNGQTVFKCIDYWKTRTPKAQLGFLQKEGPHWVNVHGLYPLSSVIRDGSWVLITYAYEPSVSYTGGLEADLVALLNGCTQAGIVCNNIHPKNLVVTASEVKLIDYGSDVRPWNEQGFEHMVRRAYLSCHFAERTDLKKLMYQSLIDVDIPELSGLEVFRSKLDYPINRASQAEFSMARAPEHEPFVLVIGVITSDPIMLQPLLSSLRVLLRHQSIGELAVIVLSNGCNADDLTKTIGEDQITDLSISIISEQVQSADAQRGAFGEGIKDRPEGQLGIALARTMLQRYVGEELVRFPNAIGWILDDDMRLDVRAREYISWLPQFRAQGVDVLLGAYEGASPNPPLNGLRVQLMDLVHNLAWLAALPEVSVLPNRSDENAILRKKFPDYYYDLSRKHTAHLESPLWIEPSYEYETVIEARARLINGAMGILNGTSLTRSIVAPNCKKPLHAARDSVNRGGCTFILNPDAVLHTPNLIPMFHDKEARRSDMIWAIINRYYRRMTIKSVGFPVQHVGRTLTTPTINAEKVQAEIVGSALYAGLTDFLNEHPQHRLIFTDDDVNWIYNRIEEHLNERLRLLKLSFYRISGLVAAIKQSPFADELFKVISCLEQEFSLRVFENLYATVTKIGRADMAAFINRLTSSADNYKNACQH